MSRIKAGVVTGDPSCEVCGNHSGCFDVYLGGEKHVFDSFECAMQVMLPNCAYCQCRIMGDGVSLGERLFCSRTCANDGCLVGFEAAVLASEQPHL